MWIPSASLAVRATPITPDNKSTAITIASWLFMITFVIMFLSRQAIKFVVLRTFGIDDLLIALATVSGIGLSVTMLILAHNGLGSHTTLTLGRANDLMKGYYTSDFLYIISLCFAKLSLVAYFYGIVVQRMQRRIVLGLGIFICIWTTCSLAAVAFRCELPRPWEIFTLKCYNIGIFWIAYAVIDMTTDVAIVMLSVNIVAYLKVKFSRKVVVVACFAPRILVIGTALARLVYLFPVTPHDDPQFNLWVPAIISQLQVCLSISTACIPYMKPFFEGVEAGVWRTDDLRRKGITPYGYGSRSGLRKGYKGGKQLYSMDSTAGTSLKFGRTPEHSPRIPSPAPLSPLTPPRYTTPPNSSSHSRSPSERGLRLHIPPNETRVTPSTDVTSPQTASSHALSPQCLSPLSPRPLLSPHRFSPTREPTPPPRSHSPRPPISSSHYGTPNSSPDPNRLSPSRSPNPNYSLFPSTSGGRYTHVPLKKVTPPLPTDSAAKQAAAYRIAANISQPSGSQPLYPPRKSSMQSRARSPARRPTVKFATTPKPSTPSPSITIPSYYTKTPTTAGTVTPSIPSYYLHTPPSMNPATFPSSQSSSPQRQRNHRVLIPNNSSRRDQISPVEAHEPRTPLTFWRVSIDAETPAETPAPISAGSMMRANKPWEDDEMPIIQDKRSSPQIVLQRSDS